MKRTIAVILLLAVPSLAQADPRKPHWLDKKFALAAGLAIGSNVASWLAIEHCRKAVLGHVEHCEGHYGNPSALMGDRMGMTVAFIALSAGYKHHFPGDNKWMIFAATPLVLNGYSAATQYRSPGPAFKPCRGTTLVCGNLE